MSLTYITTMRAVNKNQKTKVSNLIQYIVTTLSPKQVYLFGSMRSGQVHDHSDVDLLVVMQDPVDRRGLLLKSLPNRPHKDLPLDLHIIGVKEFSDMKAIGGVCFEAFRHGDLVFEDGRL